MTVQEEISGIIGAGNVLREAGRYDDAELALGAAAERFPQNEQIALARANLANARRDWPTALSRWEAARASFPDNPWCYLGSVNALRGAGRADQVERMLVTAETVLAAARQGGLNDMSALRAGFEIARARRDWQAVRQSAESIIASGAAPSAQIFLALAQACWHLGDPEAADRAALRALSVDPKLADALIVRLWAATDRGDGETALSCCRTLLRLNPAVPRWSMKLVQLLNWLGQVRESVSELECLRRRWPTEPVVGAFLRAHGLESAESSGGADFAPRFAEGDPDYGREEDYQAIADKAPGEAERVRPLLVAHLDRDVLPAEVAGAETAVLIFTGTSDDVAMPLPLFDRYLATLDVTAIYFKDFNRLRYLGGIQSLAPDYESTLAALRDMLSRLGVKRLCTIGNCVGGFAAIRYGVELGADRILAFGPTTFNPPESMTKRGDEGRNFLRTRLAANVPREMADLKLFLDARRHNAQIDVFYEEEDARRSHALRLSGLPGIRLHPEPHLTQRLLRRFALSSADFREQLAELLGIQAK